MLSFLSSLVRSSAIALFALTSLQAEATAGPTGPIANPLGDSRAIQALPVAMGEGRDHGPGYQIWPRFGGGRHWNGGGRNWGGGGRYWNGRGNWNGGWRGGHWRRGYWGGDNWGPGFALGLGLGVPLGYYGGYYGGYNGYYDGYDGYYDQPPIYRPRAYRGRNYYYRSYPSEQRRDHCDNAYLTGPNFFKCDR